MSTISALRLSHKAEFNVSDIMQAIGDTFTIEAWVRPAPVDRAAWFYPEAGFDGEPIRLKANLYKDLSQFPLSQLGSLCLPDGIEVVIFSEPNFGGQAHALRDDLLQTSHDLQTVGSLAVLDRSHRRQNFVVLFEWPNYAGRARVLKLPNAWQPAQDDSGLTQVGSAWVPPGVAVEIVHAGGSATLRGDLPQLPDGVQRIAARRDAPLQGEEMIYTTAATGTWAYTHPPQVWFGGDYGALPQFATVQIPEGSVLFLCENVELGGRCEIIVGRRDDLTDLPWTPQSGVFAAAPNGPDGVVRVSDRPRVYVSGAVGLAVGDLVWCPPGYRTAAPTEGYVEVTWEGTDNTSFSIGDGQGHQSERYAGIVTMSSGIGLAIDHVSSELRSGPDELRFGGQLLKPNRWYHLAQTFEDFTLNWYLNGRLVLQKKVATNTRIDSWSNPWVLGRKFRGALAQIRVYGIALTADQIRDHRYPSANPPELVGLNFLEDEAYVFADAADGALLMPGDLPAAPEETPLFKHIQQQITVDHKQELVAAHQKAADQLVQAHKQAQRKVARARQQARRNVHIQGIRDLGFARGMVAYHVHKDDAGGWRIHEYSDYKSGRRVSRIADLTLNQMEDRFRSEEGEVNWFVAVDGSHWSLVDIPNRDSALLNLPLPPTALVCDFSGKHASARQETDWHSYPPDNEPSRGLYWIEADGSICRAWVRRQFWARLYGTPGRLGGQPQQPLPDGPRERRQLFGFAAPTGRPGYWDLALDMDRQILYWTNGWELYWSVVADEEPHEFKILLPHVASPFPIATAVAPDGSLLWLDAEDEVVRMLPPAHTVPEIANQYLDIKPDPQRPDEPFAFVIQTREIADGDNSSLVERTVEIEPGQLYPEEPIRLNFRQGWTVVAEMVWESSNGRNDFNVHTQHVDRYNFDLVCAIQVQREDPTTAIPILLTRGDDAFDADGDRRVVSQYRMKSGQRHWVVWMLDEFGFITTYVDGYKVSEAEIAGWRNRSLYEYEPERHVFCDLHNQREWAPFSGRVERLRAWNSTTTAIAPLDVSAAKTLYPAPKPARGLAVCRLSDDLQRGAETAFVYWVSAERRTLEVPNLDTPGHYIDLYYDEAQAHGQHVAVVPVYEMAGAEWQPAKDGAPLLFASSEDFVLFDAIRLDLRRGLMVEADLIWEAVDGGMPTCLYELCTFEDEERLVCALEPDGLPVLHLRWEDHLRQGERMLTSERRLSPGQRQRVTWLMDGGGVVTTWIDGEKVLEEQTNWAGGVEVFEGHCLGSPNPAQAYPEIDGVLIEKDEDKRLFAGFQGQLFRFCAWNGYVPQDTADLSQRPGPDPTWARSLVTVESKRRYLHAARLDGKEPPITLFPLDLDAGLNIKTALDEAHAELTLAHSRLVAAEAHAAQLKQDAIRQTQADLAGAQTKLTQAQAGSDTQIALAQADRGRKQAQARDTQAQADQDAQRKRTQGQQQADQIQSDGQQQAQDVRNRAAQDKQDRIAEANRRLADAR